MRRGCHRASPALLAAPALERCVAIAHVSHDTHITRTTHFSHCPMMRPCSHHIAIDTPWYAVYAPSVDGRIPNTWWMLPPLALRVLDSGARLPLRLSVLPVRVPRGGANHAIPALWHGQGHCIVAIQALALAPKIVEWSGVSANTPSRASCQRLVRNGCPRAGKGVAQHVRPQPPSPRRPARRSYTHTPSRYACRPALPCPPCPAYPPRHGPAPTYSACACGQ